MTVIPIDDFSPITRGDTGSPFIVHFINTYTGKPVPLTGATISMRMQNVDNPEQVKDCTDSAWTIDDEENGIAHYDFQDGDVNEEGTWNMSIKITKNSKPIHADVKQLVIEPEI